MQKHIGGWDLQRFLAAVPKTDPRRFCRTSASPRSAEICGYRLPSRVNDLNSRKILAEILTEIGHEMPRERAGSGRAIRVVRRRDTASACFCSRPPLRLCRWVGTRAEGRLVGLKLYSADRRAGCRIGKVKSAQTDQARGMANIAAEAHRTRSRTTLL